MIDITIKILRIRMKKILQLQKKELVLLKSQGFGLQHNNTFDSFLMKILVHICYSTKPRRDNEEKTNE